MILCIGTTPTVQRTMIFKRLAIDAVNRAVSVEQTASGKSINVARVVRALGEHSAATGFLGGHTGQFIRRDLDHAGIEHHFVTVEPTTRTCITVIDQSHGTATELIEESKPVPPSAWDQLRQIIRRLLPRTKVMVLSGTLPPGAPADFYAECIGMAHASDVMAIVDARAEPLRLASAARPTIVKPNRTELAQTLDMPVDTDDQLRQAMSRLLEHGPQWVVVTMGKDGSILSNGQEWWRIHPPPIHAVSPIGSGDAFAAGLAVGLLRNLPMPDAAALATAAAAANALLPVAGRIRPEDIPHLQQQLRLEPL